MPSLIFRSLDTVPTNCEGRQARRRRSALWGLALLLSVTEMVGNWPAAAHSDDEPVSQAATPAAVKKRAREIIMIFGGGIGRSNEDSTSLARRNRLERAVAQSVEAEDAFKRAGGKLRFQYRSAVIGFSGVFPDAASVTAFHLALSPFKFTPGQLNIASNWDIMQATGPAEAKFATFAPSAAPRVSRGLDRIGQRLLDLNEQFVRTSIDRPVHAYILDSGIFATHAELGEAARRPDGNILEGYDEFEDTPSAQCLRHGSRVAGIVGGATTGVARGTMLHSVRVIDCAGGVELARAIKGVDWSTEHYLAARGNFAAVANMSLAFDLRNRDLDWLAGLAIFERAVRNSVSTGITYIAGAGNAAIDACDISPARMARVISVASLNPRDDVKSASSNVGPCVDLFAPGVDIQTTGSENEHDMDWVSGTSFAAPHVAGIAAIILSKNSRLKPRKVRWAILRAANKKHTKRWCGVDGRGSSPNVLLHWGAGSDDGMTDAEPPPAIPRKCPKLAPE